MKPAIVCRLKKGTFIDDNPGFVDTFNWLVDFCVNLKGDSERDQTKHIKLDRTVDDHPVIKFDGEVGDGGGGSLAVDDVSLEVIEPESGGSSQDEEAAPVAQIKGWNLASPSEATSIAEDLMAADPSQVFLVVRLYDGSLAYKAIGVFEKMDFTFDDTVITQIVADDDIDVGMKTLKAGKGIKLTVSNDGSEITIEATGATSGTQGFTGTRTVVADTIYDNYSHTLRKRFFTEQWSKGVMTSSSLGDWQTYHTAVEETVVVQDASGGDQENA